VFKTAERDVVALKDISLEIPQGQFICLLGPSGCGKSTLLNAVAGFAPPSSGTITADGKLVTGPGPSAAWCSRNMRCSPG
jgi:NitT/TauT family transport system ATP-binding protein